MKQIVIVVILAALGFAGWKFWPQVQQAIQGNGEEKKQAGANTPRTDPKGTSSDPSDGRPQVDPKVPSTPKSTGKKQPKEAPTSPLKVALELDIVTERKSGQFYFTGTTNLPENTRLLFALVGTDERGDMFVMEKSATRVFRSRAFPLSVGGSGFIVRMEVRTQSPALQQLFGTKGELLEGPLTSGYPTGRKVVVAAAIKRVRNTMRIVKVIEGDKAKAAGYGF